MLTSTTFYRPLSMSDFPPSIWSPRRRRFSFFRSITASSSQTLMLTSTTFYCPLSLTDIWHQHLVATSSTFFPSSITVSSSTGADVDVPDVLSPTVPDRFPAPALVATPSTFPLPSQFYYGPPDAHVDIPDHLHLHLIVLDVSPSLIPIPAPRHRVLDVPLTKKTRLSDHLLFSWNGKPP